MNHVVVRIPTPLRGFTDGAGEARLSGDTVGEVLSQLLETYPALRPRLLDERGELRNFVNVYVGSENVGTMNGLATPVGDGAVLSIVPAVAGGARV